jgi:hypothetical protein
VFELDEKAQESIARILAERESKKLEQSDLISVIRVIFDAYRTGAINSESLLVIKN